MHLNSAYSTTCPGGPEKLVDGRRTIAPPVGCGSQPLEVRTQCVEGASPVSGDSAMLECVPGGTCKYTLWVCL